VQRLPVLDVLIKKVNDATPEDVENADAIAIGLATYKGAGMPGVNQICRKPCKSSSEE